MAIHFYYNTTKIIYDVYMESVIIINPNSMYAFKRVYIDKATGLGFNITGLSNGLSVGHLDMNQLIDNGTKVVTSIYNIIDVPYSSGANVVFLQYPKLVCHNGSTLRIYDLSTNTLTGAVDIGTTSVIYPTVDTGDYIYYSNKRLNKNTYTIETLQDFFGAGYYDSINDILYYLYWNGSMGYYEIRAIHNANTPSVNIEEYVDIIEGYFEGAGSSDNGLVLRSYLAFFDDEYSDLQADFYNVVNPFKIIDIFEWTPSAYSAGIDSEIPILYQGV